MDMTYLTGVDFLDLEKAFIMADHNILCKKLGMYSASEQAIGWFANYLPNCPQVKVNGILSSERIHGPLLFIIYINDLGKYLTDCKCSLYADDTAIMHVLHQSYIDTLN